MGIVEATGALGVTLRKKTRSTWGPLGPLFPTFGSLLELAEACDVPVRWSCRTGVCHTCETGLIIDDVDYRPEPLEPPAEGKALICYCPRSATGGLSR